MIDTELLDDYASETRELLDEMDNSLIRLEKEGESAELLNSIFRAVHCIKGAAEYIGLERSSTLAHGVENLLDKLRAGAVELTPAMANFLFRAKDGILSLTEEAARDQEEKTDVSDMMEELSAYLSGAGAPPPSVSTPLGEEEAPEEPAPEMEAKYADVEEDVTPEEEAPIAEIEEEAVEAPSEDVSFETPTVEIGGFTTEERAEIDEDMGEITPMEAAELEPPEIEEQTPELGPVAFEPEEEALREEEGLVAEESVEEAPVMEQPSAGMITTTTTEEELEAGATLEETVPHVLNISLYLDDLEDGLSFEEVSGYLLQTVTNLQKTFAFLQKRPALPVLDELAERLETLRPTEGELSFEEIKELRSILAKLHAFYPEDTFPHEEPTLPEPSATPSEEFAAEPTIEEDFPLEPIAADAPHMAAVEEHAEEVAQFDEAPAEEESEAGPSLTEELVSAPSVEEDLSAEPSLTEEYAAGASAEEDLAVEPTMTEEFSSEVTTFLTELEKIPGVDETISLSLFNAGFTSMDHLATADEETLMSIEGISESLASDILQTARRLPEEDKRPPAERVPEGRSMLADVDSDLLDEFAGVFTEEEIVEEAPPSFTEPPVQKGAEEDPLLQDLDAVSDETDREIIEIFLSYAWEIVDSLWPILEHVKTENVSKADLEVSADKIKSIRSSSTYMDYQNLADFLDEWFERTVWASERLDSISQTNLAFFDESFSRFQSFLRALERALAGEEEEEPAVAATVDYEEAAAPHAEQVEEPAVAHPPVEEAPSLEEPSLEAEPIVAVEEPSEAPTIKEAPSLETAVRPEAEAPEPEPTVEPAAEAPRPAPTPRAEPSAQPFVQAERPEAPHAPLFAEEAAPPPTAAATVPKAEDKPAAEVSVREPDHEGPIVRTMRVDASKVDVLLNQVGELVVSRSFVEQISHELRDFYRGLSGVEQVGKREIQELKAITLKFAEASMTLERVATDLQEGVMKLRMLPVGQLFNRMPRLIRDLSRRVGKEVTLEVSGGDTEVDKRVIEQIYNPMVHLIRNAVDHGIERPEVRSQKGKDPQGTIRLSAFSQGNQVVIDVQDDGGGIDEQRVLEKAVQSGLIDSQRAEGLNTIDVYNFLFVPGFSTSRKVTRTSGRGVGMDVVKKDVEKINGHIEVRSEHGRGTTISIKIPLTLAIIQTLLIRFVNHVFAIPLTSVREIIQVAPNEITTIEGFEVIKFRDETIPILRLDRIFNVDNHDPAKSPRFLVLAHAGVKTVGFLVEELIGEQDVVIKPLAEHVCRTEGLAGSSILGDGTIAFVMDVAELLDHLITQQRSRVERGGSRARFGAN